MSGQIEAPSRALQLAASALIAAALCAAAGSMLQQREDQAQAASLAKEVASDRQRERDAAKEREQHLEGLLDAQRKDMKRDAEDRHRHIVAFAANAGRLRNELQASLAESRRAGDACARGASGIAEAAAELLDLAGEGDGLLEAATRENAELAAENQRLASQVTGLIAHLPQQVVVTASHSQVKRPD
jgi:hypothetical protein